MPSVYGALKTNKLVVQGRGSVNGNDVTMDVAEDTFMMKMGEDTLLTVAPDGVSDINDAGSNGPSTLTIAKPTVFEGDVEVKGNLIANTAYDHTHPSFTLSASSVVGIDAKYDEVAFKTPGNHDKQSTGVVVEGLPKVAFVGISPLQGFHLPQGASKPVYDQYSETLAQVVNERNDSFALGYDFTKVDADAKYILFDLGSVDLFGYILQNAASAADPAGPLSEAALDAVVENLFQAWVATIGMFTSMMGKVVMCVTSHYTHDPTNPEYNMYGLAPLFVATEDKLDAKKQEYCTANNLAQFDMKAAILSAPDVASFYTESLAWVPAPGSEMYKDPGHLNSAGYAFLNTKYYEFLYPILSAAPKQQYVVTTADIVEEPQLPPEMLNMTVNTTYNIDAFGLGDGPRANQEMADQDGDFYIAKNGVGVFVTPSFGKIHIIMKSNTPSVASKRSLAYSVIDPTGAFSWCDAQINKSNGMCYVHSGEMNFSGTTPTPAPGDKMLKILDLEEASTGAHPKIKTLWGGDWDRTNSALYNLFVPYFTDENGNPTTAEIDPSNVDVSGNIVKGTIDDAFDFMAGKSIYIDAHSIKVDSVNNLLYFAGLSFQSGVLPKCVSDSLMKLFGTFYFTGGVWAFDIDPNTEYQGKPCSENPKFLGIVGAGVTIPQRKGTEVSGAVEGTSVTLTAWASNPISKGPFYHHDLRPFSKDGRNYLALPGTPSSTGFTIDEEMDKIMWPCYIADVTDIKSGTFPTSYIIPPVPSFLSEPIAGTPDASGNYKLWPATIVPYLHDIAINADGSALYLNFEKAYFGTPAPRDIVEKWYTRTDSTGFSLNEYMPIMIYDISNLNNTQYKGVLINERKRLERKANGLSLGNYQHNIVTTKVGSREYLLQAQVSQGCNVFDITPPAPVPPNTDLVVTMYTTAWASEIGYTLLKDDVEILRIEEGSMPNSGHSPIILKIDDMPGGTFVGDYKLVCTDSYGDGWNGTKLMLQIERGTLKDITLATGALQETVFSYDGTEFEKTSGSGTAGLVPEGGIYAPKHLGFVDVHLMADKFPSLGKATDSAGRGRAGWGVTPTSYGTVLVSNDIEMVELEWNSAVDVAIADSDCRSVEAILPRVSKPASITGLHAGSETYHPMMVSHIDRESNIALLSFTDSFTSSSVATLDSSGTIFKSLTMDGNIVLTKDVSKISESLDNDLVNIKKTYKTTDPYTNQLKVYEKAPGVNYIKTQLLATDGFLVNESSSNGTVIMNSAGNVYGMVNTDNAVISASTISTVVSGKRVPMLGVIGSKMSSAARASMGNKYSSSAGYFISGKTSDLPSDLNGAVLTHVDGVKVGGSGATIYSVLSGKSAHESVPIKYSKLDGGNLVEVTADVTLKFRPVYREEWEYFYENTYM